VLPARAEEERSVHLQSAVEVFLVGSMVEEDLSARLRWAAEVSPGGSVGVAEGFREDSPEGSMEVVLDKEDLSEDFMEAASGVVKKGHSPG